MTAPAPFRWSGDAMIPLRPRAADRAYAVGEVYNLAPEEARSSASHKHYFAIIREAWLNLNEDYAERFANPEALRKWALIKAGYRDERSIVCASKAEAQRVAAFIKPMDEYALVIVRDATVIVLTAKSQSVRAMGKKDFAESKEKVLAVLAELIGVDPTELKRAEAA